MPSAGGQGPDRDLSHRPRRAPWLIREPESHRRPATPATQRVLSRQNSNREACGGDRAETNGRKQTVAPAPRCLPSGGVGKNRLLSRRRRGPCSRSPLRPRAGPQRQNGVDRDLDRQVAAVLAGPAPAAAGPRSSRCRRCAPGAVRPRQGLSALEGSAAPWAMAEVLDTHVAGPRTAPDPGPHLPCRPDAGAALESSNFSRRPAGVIGSNPPSAEPATRLPRRPEPGCVGSRTISHFTGLGPEKPPPRRDRGRCGAGVGRPWFGPRARPARIGRRRRQLSAATSFGARSTITRRRAGQAGGQTCRSLIYPATRSDPQRPRRSTRQRPWVTCSPARDDRSGFRAPLPEASHDDRRAVSRCSGPISARWRPAPIVVTAGLSTPLVD